MEIITRNERELAYPEDPEFEGIAADPEPRPLNGNPDLMRFAARQLPLNATSRGEYEITLAVKPTEHCYEEARAFNPPAIVPVNRQKPRMEIPKISPVPNQLPPRREIVSDPATNTSSFPSPRIASPLLPDANFPFRQRTVAEALIHEGIEIEI